jgi:hypothetical protein
MWTSNWTVDHSGQFGATDSDGWVYDTTFDRLIEKILARKAIGVESSTDIVRRRRFIRARTCVTAEAKLSLQKKTAKLLAIRNKFVAALANKNTDFALTTQYERERSRQFADACCEYEAAIARATAAIKENIKRLESAKQVY